VTVAIEVGCIQGDKDERGDPDEDWPERDEEVGQGSVDDGRVASYILKDIEPVSLDDNGCISHNVSTTRDVGETRCHAQRIMYKIGRPNPIRRSIASARRFCFMFPITKREEMTIKSVSKVDPLSQTRGVPHGNHAHLSNRLVRRRLSDHEIHPPLKGQRGSRDPDNCSDGNPGGCMTRTHIPNAKLLNMLSSPKRAEKARERERRTHKYHTRRVSNSRYSHPTRSNSRTRRERKGRSRR